MPCHSACSCFLSVSIQSLPVCPSVWHAAALMIFLKQTWSFRFPCSAHFCLQSEVQGSGPYFGKSALTGWLFVIIAPEYFTGCEVHKPDCRILWESAVILPVFLPVVSECKCGIAILLQEKCSWSESTLLACSDALSGFGNKSLVRYQLPSLCVGMLRPGQGMGGGCGSSWEGGGRWIAECLTNAAKVDLGVEMAILLIEWQFCWLMKNVSILLVVMTWRKWVLLLCCDLVVDLVRVCAL